MPPPASTSPPRAQPLSRAILSPPSGDLGREPRSELVPRLQPDLFHGVLSLTSIGAFTPTAHGVPSLTWIGALTSTSCDVSAVLRPDLAETRTKVARGRGTGPRRRFDVVALPT